MSRISDDEIIRTVSGDLPVGVWVARAPGGEFVYANRMFGEIMGTHAREDVAVGEYAAPYGIHHRSGRLLGEQEMPFVRALQAGTTTVQDDIVIHRPDGGRVNIRAQARPVFDDAGQISHIVIAFIDISREVQAEKARAEAESQLHRNQRLEAVGNLAGGIAHDFNNLLATIRVTTSTLRLTETDRARAEALEEIDRVTLSAANLTRSLLAFAGRGKNTAAPLSLDSVVRGVGELLGRTIGKHVEFRLDLLSGDAAVVGDRSQLEQLVMNLVMNARDAIERSGELTLRTRLVGEGGRRVQLEVADTGTGIAPELRGRIFEPYFTTKTVGANRGAGLGLATVYGIVTNHHGEISVHDNAPRGTVMRVTFPRSDLPAITGGEGLVSSFEAIRGSGCILVIEDDPGVRAATRVGLRALGYEVQVAVDGADGVEVLRRQPEAIDVVLLDLVMPRLGGVDAFPKLRELRGDLPVLLTTGFSLNEEAQALLDRGARGFIAKPYDLATLSQAVARMLPLKKSSTAAP